MLQDFDHYDLVDANCHHAVQAAWNSAVVEFWQDHSPAPDSSVLRSWERFLRWLHGTAEDVPATQRSLQAAETPLASFDGQSVRRRRRFKTKGSEAPRCRGSKLREGHRWWFQDNCPHRESCLFDESSSSGGPSCEKDCESCKKSRSRSVFLWPVLFDKDFTGFKSAGQSDSKFVRSVSCGKDTDSSASIHIHFQCFTPWSQSRGSEACSEEAQVMDPERVRSDSKAEDACSISASELSHSQAGRSKVDLDRTCNVRLEGAKLDNVDFLCQWTCNSGLVSIDEPSSSTFQCFTRHGDISLDVGATETDCLEICSSGCREDCPAKCAYLASSALDAGKGTCRNGTLATSNFHPQEMTPVGVGEVFLVIAWIILFSACSIAPCVVAGSYAKRRFQVYEETLPDTPGQTPIHAKTHEAVSSPTAQSPAMLKFGKGWEESPFLPASPPPTSTPTGAPLSSSPWAQESEARAAMLHHGSPAPPSLPFGSTSPPGAPSGLPPEIPLWTVASMTSQVGSLYQANATDSFSVLIQRFPEAGEAAVRLALEKHDGHAGRAATDLRRLGKSQATLSLTSSGYGASPALAGAPELNDTGGYAAMSPAALAPEPEAAGEVPAGAHLAAKESALETSKDFAVRSAEPALAMASGEMALPGVSLDSRKSANSAAQAAKDHVNSAVLASDSEPTHSPACPAIEGDLTRPVQQNPSSKAPAAGIQPREEQAANTPLTVSHSKTQVAPVEESLGVLQSLAVCAPALLAAPRAETIDRPRVPADVTAPEGASQKDKHSPGLAAGSQAEVATEAPSGLVAATPAHPSAPTRKNLRRPPKIETSSAAKPSTQEATTKTPPPEQTGVSSNSKFMASDLSSSSPPPTPASKPPPPAKAATATDSTPPPMSPASKPPPPAKVATAADSKPLPATAGSKAPPPAPSSNPMPPPKTAITQNPASKPPPPAKNATTDMKPSPPARSLKTLSPTPASEPPPSAKAQDSASKPIDPEKNTAAVSKPPPAEPSSKPLPPAPTTKPASPPKTSTASDSTSKTPPPNTANADSKHPPPAPSSKPSTKAQTSRPPQSAQAATASDSKPSLPAPTSTPPLQSLALSPPPPPKSAAASDSNPPSAPGSKPQALAPSQKPQQSRPSPASAPPPPPKKSTASNSQGPTLAPGSKRAPPKPPPKPPPKHAASLDVSKALSQDCLE
eukprot:TRINITY_DN91439_c0_g1_i1.p1 TRINITY_DN91439_c0_g1~~TRINITY_DN91439_c0_g1_i1.p1  ORF type:complete len:1272 (-),score=195.70 TRINITY_DN91439_c0_g1_i1:185-3748(-)